MRNTLMAIREALNIDLQVPLVVFRHELNSHALQELSNRKPQQKVVFTRICLVFKKIQM